MSRSGYSDDCDGWSLIRWRGAVNSAIKGARGQAFLRELRDALDTLPEKKLTPNELEADGEFCALGAVGRQRGIDMKQIDAEDREAVAKSFGIAEALAAEIMFTNDDDFCYGWKQETAEVRWSRVRAWVERHIKKPEVA